MSQWASDDDAGSLLAGILDETEDVARVEAEQLQAELKAKEEAQRQRAQAELAKKREDAEARLSAERQRIERAEAKRTQKMEALRIEDLKEKGEWVDPAEIAREEAERAAESEARADVARRQRAQAIAEQMAGERVEQRGTAAASGNSPALVAVTGLLLVAVVASGVLIAVLLGGYEPDAATYSKSVFVPKAAELAMVEASATPIPVAVPARDESPAATKPIRRARHRPAVQKPAAPAEKPDTAAERAEQLRKMLEDSDSIFGK